VPRTAPEADCFVLEDNSANRLCGVCFAALMQSMGWIKPHRVCPVTQSKSESFDKRKKWKKFHQDANLGACSFFMSACSRVFLVLGSESASLLACYEHASD
jgi:hypothetical protein